MKKQSLKNLEHMRVVYNMQETNVKVVQNSNVQVLFEIMQNLRI